MASVEPIHFQLPDGPFEIQKTNQSYENPGNNNEYLDDTYQIFNVFEKDKLVASYSTAMDTAESLTAQESAKEFVSTQLLENYPEFLNREQYYAEEAPFFKEVSVKAVKEPLQQLSEELKEIRNESLEFLQTNGYDEFITKRIENTDMAAEIVSEKLTRNERLEIDQIYSIYQSKKTQWDRDRTEFENQSEPSRWNVIKRMKYKTEEKRVGEEGEQLKQLENEIALKKLNVSNKVMEWKEQIAMDAGNLTSHNRCVLEVAATIKSLKEVTEKMDGLPANLPITIKGDINDTQNMSEQWTSIKHQVDNKCNEIEKSNRLGHIINNNSNEKVSYLSASNEVIFENGKWIGMDADIKVVQKLLLQGKDQLYVSQSITKHSPELAGKTAEQALKYAQKTLKQAFTPEFSKQLSSFKGMEI